MRIITGTARGTKLKTLEGKDTRPTTEMCKEGVFSAIQFAERAVIIDSSRAACEIIKENAAKTKLMKQCRIVTADWKEYLRGVKGKEKFGLVFLDPPYTEGILDEILRKIKESDILAPGAIIVCESDKDGIPTPIDGWNFKLYRYGKSHVTMIRLPEEGEE